MSSRVYDSTSYLTKILRLTEVQNTKYDQIPDEQARKAG